MSRAGTDAGFTLIEVIVVLAILALMFTIVPVSFRNVVAGAELARAARDVGATLRQARDRAIAQQREAPVEFDLEARRYIDIEGRASALPADAELSLYTAAAERLATRAAAIRFYADGGSSGGRVTLARAGRSYHVDVDWLTGAVRVHE